MKFYTSIAPFYDNIFPFKPVQKSFVKSFHQDSKEGAFLDVGCGTGGLVISLAEDFETLVGFDPDNEMLAIGREGKKAKGQEGKKAERQEGKKAERQEGKKAGRQEGLKFLPLGMMDLEANFCPETLDVITCFGNTVVHLDSEDEVQSFLYQANTVLKPGGKLLVQIINYDRILNQKLKGLPTIENDEIRFERIYEYEEYPVKVDFNTKLTVKATGQLIENSVPLLALRPLTFRKLLEKAGFTNIEEFGNFKKEAFTGDSQPYVVVAEV